MAATGGGNFTESVEMVIEHISETNIAKRSNEVISCKKKSLIHFISSPRSKLRTRVPESGF